MNKTADDTIRCQFCRRAIEELMDSDEGLDLREAFLWATGCSSPGRKGALCVLSGDVVTNRPD